jgi:chromosome partitioning protein
MSLDVLRMAEEKFGEDVCKTRISENVSLAESPALNKTIFQHAPSSRGAHDYDALMSELLTDGVIE